MNEREIQQMAEMETTYWWHRGKRSLVRSLLDKYYGKREGTILDYGCGTGENLVLLGRYGQVLGVDTSPLAVAFCRRRNLTNVQLIAPGVVPPGSYGLITALDVVEHIRDDVAMLESFHGALKPDGCLLVSVPAYRFLWSEHDEALEHVRRYMASELRAKLTMAHFRVIRITYAVSIVFPIILLYRLFRGIFPKNYGKPITSYVILPAALNSLFYTLLRIEARLVKKINLPIGCSVIALAQKR